MFASEPFWFVDSVGAALLCRSRRSLDSKTSSPSRSGRLLCRAVNWTDRSSLVALSVSDMDEA